MKAVVIENQGSVENLTWRDWPDPETRPKDALIEVRAVGLNHLDVFVRRGMPGYPVPMPHISGGDIAGVIKALGPEVSGWSIGQRVVLNPISSEGMLGESHQGGMAELVRTPAANLIQIPDHMGFITAAAIPINFGTALRMLHTIGNLKAGELVLVLGASGGVGTACIQLAKRAGAVVIAVTRGSDKVTQLRKLGADHVIDMLEQDFSAAAWKLSGKKGVDLVINYTGGDTWVPSLRALRRRGKLITCGATGGFNPPTDIRYIWTRELQVRGSDGYTQQDIADAIALCANGELRPLVSHVLKPWQAAEAHLLLEDRKLVGKVVLDFAT